MTNPVTYRGRTHRAKAHHAAGNRAQAASILLRSVRDLQDEHSDYGTERTWKALQELFPGVVDEAESLEGLQEALTRIAEQARILPGPREADKPEKPATVEAAWQVAIKAAVATGNRDASSAARLARSLYLKASRAH